MSKFMILKVFVILAITFVGGCSTFPEKVVERAVRAAELQKTANVRLNLNQRQDKLTPEILYLLLSAELAAQRGIYDVAIDGYVQVAEKVFDPKVG